MSCALAAEQLCERGLVACVGSGPLVLEIGFGRAELLLALAEARPERSFLGVEISRKRVLKSQKRVEARGLENVWLVHATAEYLLERVIPDAAVAECWINCPDPWPKKRHHKRRLLQKALGERLARVLEVGGVLHISTDHAAYAEWIRDVLSKVSGLQNLHAPAAWSDKRPERVETAYEATWRAEGRPIAYLDYIRESEA